MGNFPKFLNFNQLFLKLNRFICNYNNGWFPPFICDHMVGILDA